MTEPKAYPPSIYAVDGVTGIVDRFGGVYPIVKAIRVIDSDSVDAKPGSAFSGPSSVRLLNLLRDDIITVEKTAAKSNFVTGVVESQNKGTHDILKGACTECKHPLVYDQFYGLMCINDKCPGKLASRLTHLGSQDALRIPILTRASVTPLSRSMYSIADVYDPDFGATLGAKTPDSAFVIDSIRRAVYSTKMHFQRYNLTTDQMVVIVSSVVNSLCIPGLTPGITSTLVRRVIETYQADATTTLQTVLSGVRRIDFLAQFGIPNIVALPVVNGANKETKALTTVSAFMGAVPKLRY